MGAFIPTYICCDTALSCTVVEGHQQGQVRQHVGPVGTSGRNREGERRERERESFCFPCPGPTIEGFAGGRIRHEEASHWLALSSEGIRNERLHCGFLLFRSTDLYSAVFNSMSRPGVQSKAEQRDGDAALQTERWRCRARHFAAEGSISFAELLKCETQHQPSGVSHCQRPRRLAIMPCFLQ